MVLLSIPACNGRSRLDQAAPALKLLPGTPLTQLGASLTEWAPREQCRGRGDGSRIPARMLPSPQWACSVSYCPCWRRALRESLIQEPEHASNSFPHGQTALCSGRIQALARRASPSHAVLNCNTTVLTLGPGKSLGL